MKFDSRDLTVKLMAGAQGGDCQGCTDTQRKPPDCKGCTDTQDDANCNVCTLTENQSNPPCQQGGDDEMRRSQAALAALRRQLGEALSGQAG